MDRLGTDDGARGWLAFDGGAWTAHEIAARIAQEAKRRGHETRTARSPRTARVVMAFPEGEAAVEVLEVPGGGARNRVAICRRGHGEALRQARALLRETIERSGGSFVDALACDDATWRTLPELEPHRAAVRRRRAADVVAGFAWLAVVPAALAMGLFVFFDLAMTRMTCGPEPAGSHGGEILTIGLIGLALFAAPFLPAVLLLRAQKRTLARSVGALSLAATAIAVALADLLLLAMGTMC